jgi:cobyrinic acid a,c-diamide synthase
VPPEEHEHKLELESRLLEATEGHLDFDALLACARGAAPLVRARSFDTRAPDSAGLRIGYIRDSAFTFYYPENLEALEESGATLVPVSSLSGAVLPEDLHGLYIGGGFPETHAAVISRNTTFLGSLARAAAKGLPVYAECGGLMLLARAIRWKSDRQLMAGVLPIEVEVCEKPQGHGYAVLRVDEPNPFFAAGTELKGHEFHYSRIVPAETLPPTACRVERGAGCYSGRDGISLENVWASYTHLHALATPEWAAGLLAAARRFAVGDEECKDCACSVALEC